MTVQMACNTLRQPCGCTEWLEFDRVLGCWIQKRSVCYGHENAATR